jgi:predicted nucleic acid-binding protein
VILVDTGPLVALCDPRVALHERAKADLDRVARRRLVTCAPVLTEACFLLERPAQRARLERILRELGVQCWRPEDEVGVWIDVFAWLGRYAEHGPDWADGFLCVAAARESGSRVWSYDREFRTTWRRPDGSKVPLAVP